MQQINYQYHKKWWVVIIIAAYVLFGCGRAQERTEAPVTFFDLKGYFQQEIKRLETSNYSFAKTVRINDSTEHQQSQTLHFEQELTPFIQCDINRRDWLDKYQVDSVIENGYLTALRYTAQDERLRTRVLDIQFQQNLVHSVQIKTGGQSTVAGSTQQLQYQPQQGYSIQSIQQTLLGKDKNLEINVLFIEK
ncbi:MAG TPA: hypothetical protein PKD70_07200 [Saprospiraceae bacterium]|nr:hypothetical protein [Saprospiraceae bacterium]HMP13649.1 hypothetical protein [Saprospiraceae bacterium]